jgi:hypothetical protein
LSDFDFTVQYIPGDTNILTDTLSRIYSADAPGTVCAESEFVSTDAEGGIPVAIARVLDAMSRPVYTDPDVVLASVMPFSMCQSAHD